MVSTSKNKIDDHQVKETCSIKLDQYKLYMKPTSSFYYVVQQCQMQ